MIIEWWRLLLQIMWVLTKQVDIHIFMIAWHDYRYHVCLAHTRFPIRFIIVCIIAFFVISSQGIHAINCPHCSVLLHWRRVKYVCPDARAWWRHQMDTFPAFLAICAGNSPVTSEFPIQRPVTRSFGVFFDLRLNKQLSKQSCGRWFETSSRPLWRHHNE